MPSSDTPRPKCASIVPKAERGRPRARVSAVANGKRSKPVRSMRSVTAPAMTKAASPMPNGASTGPPLVMAKVAAITTRANAAAPTKRCATPRRSPRFQAINGPNGTTSRSGTNSGPKVRLKNGAPTDIFSPVKASSASG